MMLGWNKKEKKPGAMDIMGIAKTLMSHPKGMKGAIPEMLTPAIDQGQEKLKEYLNNIPLEKEETHCTVVTQFNEYGELFFIVAAFQKHTFSRAIGTHSTSQLIDLITEML